MRQRSFLATGVVGISTLLGILTVPAAVAASDDAAAACTGGSEPCVGVLEAGPHASAVFTPGTAAGGPGGLTFEVPAGWALADDSHSSLRLVPDWEFAREDLGVAQAYNGIDVFARTAAAEVTLGCAFAEEPGIGHDLDALTAFITGHPGIVAKAPEEMDLGGRRAVVLDFALAPDWTTTCPDLGVYGPAVALTTEAADDPSYVWGIGLGIDWSPGAARLILIDLDEAGVASVWVAASTAGRAEEFVAETESIIASMRFQP